MPIYEYICPNCNGRFQKLVQGFSDPAGLACPRCASTAVQRAVSRVFVAVHEAGVGVACREIGRERAPDHLFPVTAREDGALRDCGERIGIKTQRRIAADRLRAAHARMIGGTRCGEQHRGGHRGERREHHGPVHGARPRAVMRPGPAARAAF